MKVTLQIESVDSQRKLKARDKNLMCILRVRARNIWRFDAGVGIKNSTHDDIGEHWQSTGSNKLLALPNILLEAFPLAILANSYPNARSL
jgi:hypothetical protein